MGTEIGIAYVQVTPIRYADVRAAREYSVPSWKYFVLNAFD